MRKKTKMPISVETSQRDSAAWRVRSASLAHPLAWFVLLLILLFLTVGGFGPLIQAQDRIDSDLLEVTAAIPRDFPPHYALDETGQPVGFAIDVMDQIAALAGLRVTYLVEDSWREVAEALRSGRADLIPNNGITAGRQTEFAFTAPVETIAVSIFVRQATTEIQSEADLAGHTIAVVETNIAVGLLQDRQDVNLLVFRSVNDALFQLLAGQVDALVYPQSTLLRSARSVGVDDRIKIVGEPLIEVKRAIAVRKENTELLARLNEAVDHFVGTADYQEIYVKWYGQAQPFWTPARVAWSMGGLLLLTLAAGTGWRYYSTIKLNRQLVQNIAQRVKAEEALAKSEKKYRQLIELAQEGIWVIDQEAYTTFVNPRMAEMLGYTIEDMQGKHLFSFMDDRGVEIAQRNLVRRKRGIKEQHDFEFLRKDGTRMYAALETAPITGDDGNYRGAIAGVIDITERKKAQEVLKAYSERLEEMVEARTKKLKEAQEALIRKEKLAALGQLAGSVAHELRNPLGTIKNAAYFLNLALEDPQPEVKEVIEILDQKVTIADEIITSLLDFTRTRKTTWRQVDVNDLLQQTVSQFPSSEDPPIEIVTRLDETLPPLLADPHQLGQVFRNLIHNAIQAMPQGGRLTIQSKVAGPKEVAICFTDMGVGIAPENLDKVFEPLFSTKATGIGLGLALVRTLVEAHGGRIGLESQEGQGSTFTVKLPLDGLPGHASQQV